MLGLVLVGAVAFELLPVAPLPQVDFPTIRIDADLPGASAETMASSVATPLERSLSDISGIASMTSSSSLGTTSIRRWLREPIPAFPQLDTGEHGARSPLVRIASRPKSDFSVRG
jgi:hypothetical protein